MCCVRSISNATAEYQCQNALTDPPSSCAGSRNDVRKVRRNLWPPSDSRASSTGAAPVPEWQSGPRRRWHRYPARSSNPELARCRERMARVLYLLFAAVVVGGEVAWATTSPPPATVAPVIKVIQTSQDLGQKLSARGGAAFQQQATVRRSGDPHLGLGALPAHHGRRRGDDRQLRVALVHTAASGPIQEDDGRPVRAGRHPPGLHPRADGGLGFQCAGSPVYVRRRLPGGL